MATSSKGDLRKQAKFIFTGTVKKLHAATMSAVTDTDKTIVVHVDTILQAPELLKGFQGKDVTVHLDGTRKPTVGQQRTFYTNGWLFGDSLAVKAVGHEAARPQPLAQAAAAQGAHTVLADQEIRNRAEQADLVVTGKVTAVGLPSTPAMAAAKTTHKPISEHEPQWREAVVEVQTVHKGKPTTKQVVVRFPNSTDVRWFKAPKFQAGQEGLFMLQHDAITRVKAGATALALGAPATAAFTCLHATDFIPVHHDDEMAVAIDAATSTAKA
jgi:hypothetical protein